MSSQEGEEKGQERRGKGEGKGRERAPEQPATPRPPASPWHRSLPSASVGPSPGRPDAIRPYVPAENGFLMEHDVCKVHPRILHRTSFLFMLNNIPLCG